MSFTTTISNALSGLAANTRAAGVVSDNIANAQTEGYGRRELELTSRRYGGVRAEGVRRAESPRLTADIRTAEAGRGAAAVSQDALARIERSIGSPDQPGSLGARLAGLESALVSAAADPASEAELTGLLSALTGVTGGLKDASVSIQGVRTEVEAAIAADVEALDASLRRIAKLNAEIAKARPLGRDVNPLLDQRRGEIDTVAGIAPVRVFERADGMVTLIARGGATLLEGTSPAKVEFQPAGLVTAAMDVDAGGLERVTLRGEPIDPGTFGKPLSGGTLGARLALRDETLPAIQSRLDGFAADFARRVEEVQPGLLTDGGGPLPATLSPPEPGFAGQLGVAAAVDPARGGDVTRLRDGVSAAVRGPSGRSELLRGLADALGRSDSAPAGFAPGGRDSSGLMADVASGVASSRLAADAEVARASASVEILRQEERVDGVDTDAELQRLLQIERSYAAGARVLQAVDEMMFRLMEI